MGQGSFLFTLPFIASVEVAVVGNHGSRGSDTPERNCDGGMERKKHLPSLASKGGAGGDSVIERGTGNLPMV